MTAFNKKEHWETIYQTKALESVSWYQPTPYLSLEFIEAAELPKSAKIIDIGGGDSFLADRLLEKGYTDISVLDISSTAIERAKKRLGDKANLIKWIVADIISFEPKETYDIWHDRAAFHFLTSIAEVEQYKNILTKSLNTGARFIVGTFTEDGPTKCSGIEIKQYSEQQLKDTFGDEFTTLNCSFESHTTPSGSVQQFIFCVMLKNKNPA